VNLSVKKIENRSTFGEVMDSIVVPCFFDSQCIYVCVPLQKWKDARLSWERSSYNEYETLRVSPSRIWKPDLRVLSGSAQTVVMLFIYFNKSSAAAEMGYRLATTDVGRKLGACTFSGGGELGPI